LGSHIQLFVSGERLIRASAFGTFLAPGCTCLHWKNVSPQSAYVFIDKPSCVSGLKTKNERALATSVFDFLYKPCCVPRLQCSECFLSATGIDARRFRFARTFHTTTAALKAAEPVAVPLSKLSDNFLDGTSSVWLEDLQRAWETDPKSVDPSWDIFFQ
jgi:hypothetical protein